MSASRPVRSPATPPPAPTRRRGPNDLDDDAIRELFVDLHVTSIREATAHRLVVLTAGDSPGDEEGIARRMRDAEGLTGLLHEDFAYLQQEAPAWLGDEVRRLFDHAPQLRWLELRATSLPLHPPTVTMCDPLPGAPGADAARRLVDSMPPIVWWSLMRYPAIVLEAKAPGRQVLWRFTRKGLHRGELTLTNGRL